MCEFFWREALSTAILRASAWSSDFHMGNISGLIRAATGHVVGQSAGHTLWLETAERLTSTPFSRICHGTSHPSEDVKRRHPSSLSKAFARSLPPACQITWKFFEGSEEVLVDGCSRAPPSLLPGARSPEQVGSEASAHNMLATVSTCTARRRDPEHRATARLLLILDLLSLPLPFSPGRSR